MAKLTAQVKAGGCASKLSPRLLDQVLPRIPRLENPHVLVGFDTSDDAGVYQLTPECALVQTVDFFTPVVDDPYTFGAIAAANALSDVYAMGGTPISALSIVAFPADGDLNDLREILAGGVDKLREADCVLLGGHSVNDPEIKFGLAVTGTVHPERVLTNAGAKAGDVLLFTKSLGTGVVTTALKRGIAQPNDVDAATQSMLTLNRAAASAMTGLQVHACTDVSGFGLLGHAREMAVASRLTLEIEADALRLLPGALESAAAGAISAGLRNNREFVESCVRWGRVVPSDRQALFYDPQTSGGLLIAIAASDVEMLLQRLPAAYPIGHVVALREKPLEVV